MKNKKIAIIVILLCLLGQLNIINYCAAFPCNIFYLNSDKNIYYLDEEILVNASWELNYNPNVQISFIKIQIFDSYNNNLWESPKYEDIGIHEENWTIKIQNLNISFSNSSYLLYIKFYIYLYNSITQELINDYIGTIPIQILKRNLLCQLIGYPNYLLVEEALDFQAKFYFQSSENISFLVNHTISFEILKDNEILYSQNLTTNFEGVIRINISNISKITNGQNIIRFSLQNDPILNDCILKYSLFIHVNENMGNSSEIFTILLIPIIVIGSLMLMLIYRHLKRLRQKALAELTIEI